MSDDSNRFSAVFGSSGGSGGGGGGADEKVKVNGSDPTADYLGNKMVDDGGYTTLLVDDTTTDPTSYTRVSRAIISRYDNVGVTENFASGSPNTLGGFSNVVITGSENTAVGFNVFNLATGVTKSVGVGNSIAPTLVLAQQITAIGQKALQNLATAGDEQVAVGSQALQTNTGNIGGATTGDFNVSIGTDSMALLDGGYRNTALGHNAGGVITTGARNTLIGFEVGLSALTNITTGNDNILMGYQTDTDGDENLIIGNDSNTQLGSVLANQNTIIGHNSTANSSLQVIVGYNGTILNGGQDVLIGVNNSIDGSSFPTFATLNTHVGSSGIIVGFYNQSLGYNQTITGDDNNAYGNFHTINGNDCILVGNGLTINNTQAYVFGVDSSSMVDYACQFSWNDGVTQYDDVRLVSRASSVGNKSFMLLKADFELNAPSGFTNSGNFMQNNFSYHDNEQTETILGGGSSQPNLQDGNLIHINLQGNGSMLVPINARKGTYYFIIQQDGTGGHTLSWAVDYLWVGGSAPVVSSGANQIDIFMVQAIFDTATSTTRFYCSIVGQNFT